MRRFLVLTALALVALVIAACGGSGDDSSDDSGDAAGSGSTTAESTESAPITREQFVEMADAICAANDEEQDQLRVELDNASSPEEAAEIYDRVANLSEGTISEITALPPPAGDEATIDELAALQTEGVELIRALAAAVRADDQATGVDIIAQLEQNDTERDAGDAAFGFKAC